MKRASERHRASFMIFNLWRRSTVEFLALLVRAQRHRVRKLARKYVAKAPERFGSLLRSWFLVVPRKGLPFIHTSRDLQTRVACGKLRLCTQASIRHSDVVAMVEVVTSPQLLDVVWCSAVVVVAVGVVVVVV